MFVHVKENSPLVLIQGVIQKFKTNASLGDDFNHTLI